MTRYLIQTLVYMLLTVVSLFIAVDGGWSDWSEFSQCSVTCGGGKMARSRVCDNPLPQHGGNNCTGAEKEIERCNTYSCPGK